MRYLQTLLLVLILGPLGMACDEESEIRTKAGWLCKHGQIDPQPDYVPEGTKLSDYILEDDLQYLKEQDEEESTSAFSGLGEAMAISLDPGIRAIRKAQSEARDCKVGEIAIGEDGALAQIAVAEPDLELGLSNMKEVARLAKLETEGERIEKVKSWFEAAETQTANHELRFVKRDDQWVADLGLRATGEVTKMLETAVELYESSKYVEARDILAEAVKIAPPASKKVAQDSLDNVQKEVDQMVADAWIPVESEDPMGDHKTRSLMLLAEKRLPSRFGNGDFPTIYVRCRRGTISVYLNTTERLKSDYKTDTTYVRYRFGDAKPVPERFPVSTDKQAIFFTNEFFEKMLGHSGERFVVEFRDHSNEFVAEFELRGLDEAYADIKSACGS